MRRSAAAASARSLLRGFVGLLLFVEHFGLLLNDGAHDISDGDHGFGTIGLIHDPDTMVAEFEHFFDDGSQRGLVRAREGLDVLLAVLMEEGEYREQEAAKRLRSGIIVDNDASLQIRGTEVAHKLVGRVDDGERRDVAPLHLLESRDGRLVLIAGNCWVTAQFQVLDRRIEQIVVVVAL